MAQAAEHCVGNTPSLAHDPRGQHALVVRAASSANFCAVQVAPCTARPSCKKHNPASMHVRRGMGGASLLGAAGSQLWKQMKGLTIHSRSLASAHAVTDDTCCTLL